MKKQNRIFTLISILSFIGINSYSQIVYINNNSPENPYANHSKKNYNYTYYDGMTNSYFNKKEIKERQIKEVDITILEYKKNGKRAIEKDRYIEKFNKEAHLIESINFNKGLESSHNIYQYDNNNRIDTKRWYKGKNYSHSINKYNQYNQLIQRDSYWNNKFQSRSIASYQDSRITAQWNYSKDSTKVRNKWEYSYYPNWDKKTTRYYKNGELKHTWNYTCNEDGEEKKPKEETKVCELKQYNADSSYVIIRRLTDEKGKISKRKFTYNKNKNLILTEYFNIKNKLTYKDSSVYKNEICTENYHFFRGKNSSKIQSSTVYHFDSNGNKTDLKKVFYNKPGIIAWVHEYKFNKAGKTLESTVYGKNKKIELVRKHKYDENNKEISSKRYNADGSLKFKIIKTYDKKGLLVRSDTYNRKNNLTRTVIRKYQFFE